MSGVALGDIRACFEGAIPSIIATCDAQGVPNVAYISQVYYVDERHVALSFQFFNKTRQNILANPHANVLVLHPVTAEFYRLHIRYLRAMEHELAVAGYSPEFTRAMFGSQHDDVVAITFAPEQAFEQTPGPRAGTRLEGA